MSDYDQDYDLQCPSCHHSPLHSRTCDMEKQLNFIKLATMEHSQILSLQSRLISEISNKWEAELKSYLRENLGKIGYLFDSEPEFLAFVKDRVTKVHLAQDPHSYFLYVDFISLEEPGIQVGSFNTHISYSSDRGDYRGHFEITMG